MIPSDVIAALLGLDWHDEELLVKCRAWNHSIFRWSETFGEDDEVTRVQSMPTLHDIDGLVEALVHDATTRA